MCLSMLAVLMDMFSIICCFPPVARHSDLVCVCVMAGEWTPLTRYFARTARTPHPVPRALPPACHGGLWDRLC